MTGTHQSPAVPSPEDFERINDLVTGHWKSQAVRAAVKLCLPDHLSSGGLTAEELAHRAGSPPDTTFRLMRACVTLGLLSADSEGRFYGSAADLREAGHTVAEIVDKTRDVHRRGANRELDLVVELLVRRPPPGRAGRPGEPPHRKLEALCKATMRMVPITRVMQSKLRAPWLSPVMP